MKQLVTVAINRPLSCIEITHKDSDTTYRVIGFIKVKSAEGDWVKHIQYRNGDKNYARTPDNFEGFYETQY